MTRPDFSLVLVGDSASQGSGNGSRRRWKTNYSVCSGRRSSVAEPDGGTMSKKGMGLPKVRDHRAFERFLVDTGRLLQEHEFSSIEEANAFLQSVTVSGSIPHVAAATPLEQAQDLMYEAWGASGKRRVKLARQALEISGDCADAYVLLAEESAQSLEEARDLYEQGTKAGERALGPEAFKEYAGDFWGALETRPYMRARVGLANTLWTLGEDQQAIAHYTELLRLNPGDNQGLRYCLASVLQGIGDDEALGRLLRQYKDDVSADWAYTRTLWVFRHEGVGSKANRALLKALETNAYVPFYLFGLRKLPRRPPDTIGFGDESEAVAYVGGAIRAWCETPGALEWVADYMVKHEPGPPRKLPAKP